MNGCSSQAIVTEIDIEDRQLQKQTQRKRFGDLTLVLSLSMLCMTQPTNISLNGVERTRRSASKISLGGRASMR